MKLDWLKEFPETPEEEAESNAWWAEQAKRIGPQVVAAKQAELVALITIYADADAEAAFQSLREWFWGTALSDALFAERAARSEGRKDGAR